MGSLHVALGLEETHILVFLYHLVNILASHLQSKLIVVKSLNTHGVASYLFLVKTQYRFTGSSYASVISYKSNPVFVIISSISNFVKKRI